MIAYMWDEKLIFTYYNIYLNNLNYFMIIS